MGDVRNSLQLLSQASISRKSTKPASDGKESQYKKHVRDASIDQTVSVGYEPFKGGAHSIQMYVVCFRQRTSPLTSFASKPQKSEASPKRSNESSVENLSLAAAASTLPDGVDWDNYYWGFPYRAFHNVRAPAVFPLPPHITDRVPVEIIDYIIGFLANDRRTLRTCMSICRTWYNASVCPFYSSISLCRHRQYIGLVHMSRQSANVRSLLIGTRSLSLAHDGNDKSFFHVAPLALAPVCPNIEHLTFQGCPASSGRSIHPTFTQYLPLFKRVTHLTLRAFALCSFASVQRIICAFPALAQLELFDGSLTTAAHSNAVCSGPGLFPIPKLKKLTLVSLGPSLLELLVNWLFPSDAHGIITSLCVEQDFAASKGPICKLLQMTAPSVKNLHLIDTGHGNTPFGRGFSQLT